jgi:hypothetical protein
MFLTGMTAISLVPLLPKSDTMAWGIFAAHPATKINTSNNNKGRNVFAMISHTLSLQSDFQASVIQTLNFPRQPFPEPLGYGRDRPIRRYVKTGQPP